MKEGLIVGDGAVKGAFPGGQITLKALDELDLIGCPEDAIRLKLIHMLAGMVVLAKRPAVKPLGNSNLLSEIKQQRLLIDTIAVPFLFDLVKFGRIFVGKNELFRAESVFERVLAGGRLAFGATRTGGAVRILFFAIGHLCFRTRVWRGEEGETGFAIGKTLIRRKKGTFRNL